MSIHMHIAGRGAEQTAVARIDIADKLGSEAADVNRARETCNAAIGSMRRGYFSSGRRSTTASCWG